MKKDVIETGLFGLTCYITIFLFISLIICNYILSNLGIDINIISFIVTNIIILIIIIFSGFRIKIKTNILEVISYFVLIISLVIIIFSNMDSDLMPTTSGPDLVHFYLLADYITDNGKIPEDIKYLGVMSDYPFGSLMVIGSVARYFSIETIKLIYLFSGLYLILSYIALSAIIKKILIKNSSRKGDYLVLFLPLSIFFPLMYYIQAISGITFFISMIFGILISMLLIFLSFELKNRKDQQIKVLMFLTIVIIIFSYTILLPFAILVLLYSLIIKEKNIIKYLRKKKMIIKDILYILMIIIIFIIFIYKRLVTGNEILSTDGPWNKIYLEYNAFIFIVLFFIGLIIGTVKAKYRLLLAPFILIMIQTVIMLIVKYLFNIGTYYHSIKMFYLVYFVMALIIPIPFVELIDYLRKKNKIIIINIINIFLLIIIMGSVFLYCYYGPENSGVISQDEYECILWFRENYPKEINNIEYVITGNKNIILTVYWMHYGILRNPPHQLSDQKRWWNSWCLNKKLECESSKIDNILFDNNYKFIIVNEKDKYNTYKNFYYERYNNGKCAILEVKNFTYKKNRNPVFLNPSEFNQKDWKIIKYQDSDNIEISANEKIISISGNSVDSALRKEIFLDNDSMYSIDIEYKLKYLQKETGLGFHVSLEGLRPIIKDDMTSDEYKTVTYHFKVQESKKYNLIIGLGGWGKSSGKVNIKYLYINKINITE